MVKKNYWLLVLAVFIPQIVISAEAKSTKSVKATTKKSQWGPSQCNPYAIKKTTVFTNASSSNAREKCRDNLEEIGEKLLDYAAAHSGKYPDDPKEVRKIRKKLKCPVTKKEYIYVAGQTSASDANTPLLYCTKHYRKKTKEYQSVLFVNGKIGKCKIED